MDVQCSSVSVWPMWPMMQGYVLTDVSTLWRKMRALYPFSALVCVTAAHPLPPLPACGRSRKVGEAGEREKAEAAAAKEVERARVEEVATAPPRAALVGAEAETVRARTTASAPVARWGCPTIVNSVAPLRRARSTSPRTGRRKRPMSIGDMGRLARRRRPLPVRGGTPQRRSVPLSNGSWKPG